MRAFGAVGAIGAAFLVVWLLPAEGRADGPGPAAAQPGCKCPPVKKRVVKRRVVRHHFAADFHPPPLPDPPPDWYNPGLPSPYDSAYDRAMMLHFRSPPVTGYREDAGYPATPPYRAVHYYRVPAGAGIAQYDGLIGEYVLLAQDDPAHHHAAAAGAMAHPPPPPPPPSPVGPHGGERG